MRQGQQHRRGRGRNNNNSHNQNYGGHNNNHRKGNNPLSRSFESNGPEVKVRGTPAHVAEKYLSLARDAQSAGDPVLAENYLQHAEHYNRIILAYREQQVQQSGEMNGGGGHRMRPDGMEGDEASDDQPDDPGQGDQPPMPRHQHEQPRFHDQHRGGDDRQQNREYRGHDQGRFRDRHERHDRQDRDRQDRQPQEPRQPQEMRQPAQDRGAEPQPAIENGAPPSRADNPGRRRERFGPGNEQPEFLRRPVRRPRREAGNGDGEEAAEAGRDESQDKTTV
jgi:hypothetical protein